jgi:hypothetical protein
MGDCFGRGSRAAGHGPDRPRLGQHEDYDAILPYAQVQRTKRLATER